MKHRPTISACLMVKNEARGIERCLTSLRAAGVDEIVLIDTGSTDGTQDIARPLVDIYAESQWQDFATNRNETLDLATSDYILVIDGDEWLDEPEQFGRVREAITEGVSAVFLTIRNYLPESEPKTARQCRVFRNDPAIRYRGTVHHYFNLDDYLSTTGTTSESVDVTINHDGYALDFEARRRKYLPRLKYYAAEIESAKRKGKDGLVGYYNYKLGEMLVLAGEYPDAVYHLTLALPTLKPVGERRALILVAKGLLGTITASKGKLEISRRHQIMLGVCADKLIAFGDEEAVRHGVGIYDLLGKRAKAKRLYRQHIDNTRQTPATRSPSREPETTNAAAKPTGEPVEAAAA